MKRVIVYDVEQKKPESATKHSEKIQANNTKQESWEKEKRIRAMKTIENASVLSGIVKSIETLKLNDPNEDGQVIKEAVEKISSIVEEMRKDFKKDYWD
ncbi:MAG: hypothetical protein EBU90_07210 [Proteobacteria bacterium]|nr:hypothetical protein [Pseudomonadota bacterium]